MGSLWKLRLSNNLSMEERPIPWPQPQGGNSPGNREPPLRVPSCCLRLASICQPITCTSERTPVWRDHGMWLCFSLARQCWSPSFTKRGLSFLIDKTETAYISASLSLSHPPKPLQEARSQQDKRRSKYFSV